MPDGRCSKAFCSSDFSIGEVDVGFEGERLESECLMGEPSTGVVWERFLGRPRSIIEALDSDSWRR
jgi:hypothetical protein